MKWAEGESDSLGRRFLLLLDGALRGGGGAAEAGGRGRSAGLEGGAAAGRVGGSRGLVGSLVGSLGGSLGGSLVGSRSGSRGGSRGGGRCRGRGRGAVHRHGARHISHQGVLLSGGGGSDGLDGALQNGLRRGNGGWRRGRSFPHALGVARLILEVVYGLKRKQTGHQNFKQISRVKIGLGANPGNKQCESQKQGQAK